jgi:HK97 family phage major capsid protein
MTIGTLLKIKARLIELGLLPEGTTDLASVKVSMAKAIAAGALSDEDLQTLEAEDVMTTTKSADPKQVFGGSNSVRVKDPVAAFSTAKSAGVHRKTGKPVMTDKGRPVELASERELAEFGAFIKRLGQRSLGSAVVEPTDTDLALLAGLEQKEWCGTFNGAYERGLGTHLGVKALLDDVASGGIEAAPIVFDDMLITTPLLHSEFFPYVQVIDLSRGRRVEGTSWGNVTINSGGGDNTEISLFNTATFISAFDTSIYVADFAVTIGRDFLSDSPIDVGATMQSLIGEKLAAWLDEQILLGDGTTEMEGIFVGGGSTSVASDNGSPGPWTFADHLDLMFSVGKQYRRASEYPCFFSNDTVYARGRGIKIDTASPSTDQRPVFGLDAVNSYVTLDWPHKIQNSLSNRRLGFGCLKRYRCYRRVGFSFEVHTQGSTLARSNLALIIARARFGGQMANPDAFALITDGQT